MRLCAQSLPGPWTARDIGAVGVPGASACNPATGAFALSGAGAAIGGTADAFHFLSQSMDGDFRISARISGPEGAGPAARAGLMVRQAATPGAAHAMLALSPGGGLSLQYRLASSGPSYVQPWTPGRVGQWLRLERTGGWLVASRSEDGETWECCSAERIAFTGPVLAGFVISSGDPKLLASAVIENSHLDAGLQPSFGPAPVPWRQENVGTVSAIPAAMYDGASGTWLLGGGGLGISGTADSFSFLHRTWFGDGKFVVRVRDVPSADAGRVGLMVRESMAPESRHVTLHFPRLGKNASLVVRKASAGATATAASAASGMPGWLKLERMGDRFTGFLSSDGLNWTQFAQVIQPLGSKVEFGIALSNGSATRASTGVFSGLALTAFDGNGNGLPDAWETAMFGHLQSGAAGDADGDGLANWEEFVRGTNPANAFSSGGPLNDRESAVRNPVAPVTTALAAVQRDGLLEWNAWSGWRGPAGTEWGAPGLFAGRPVARSFVSQAAAPANYGDNFGQRLRGTITAPVSGSYTFWIAADESAVLWLGQGASRLGKRPIASVGSPVGVRNWDSQPRQKSAPVTLVAGQQYWIEALAADTTGSDHLEIAWEYPGQARQLIPAQALRTPDPEAADADDDNLPDTWAAASGVQGGFADPDNDGLSNYDEFRLGTDPLVAGGVPGCLSRQVWHGLSGWRVRDMVRSARFLRPPDWADLVTGASLPATALYDNFGERLRGTITAPVTGKYTFWIAGDDNCELWLGADAAKFQKRRIAWLEGPDSEGAVPFGSFDGFGSQKSVAIELQGGRQYYLEILHKESTGSEHVEVAWALPGSAVRQPVPSAALASFVREPNDLDDDDLPDDWERASGLNPADNGATDPLQGAAGDLDGDGLSNREEYLLGTNPAAVDTDGDGTGDREEALVYGSDPTRQDIASFQPVSTFSPATATRFSGDWVPVEGSDAMWLAIERGSLDFDFTLPEAGLYALQIDLANGPMMTVNDVRLKVAVDGRLAGRIETRFGQGERRLLSVLLPWLEAGSHTLHVADEVARHGHGYVFHSFSLLKATGLDANGDGRPDWAAALLAGRNGFKARPGTSLTSPVCLEGRGDFQTISAPAGLNVCPAPNQGWYANADLPADGSPRTVELGFESGALRASQSVAWAAANLAFLEGPLLIRAGDALRLTAYTGSAPGPDAVAFSVDGAGIGATPADKPLVYRFSKPGLFTVRAAYLTADGASAERSVQVRVVGAGFSGSPVAMVRQSRDWDNPALDPQLPLEFDGDVFFTSTALAGGGSRLRFTVPDLRPHTVAARLFPGGPVLAHARIRPQQLFSANDTSVRLVDSFPDGSQVMVMNVVVSELQPDTVVQITIHAGGVVFNDTGSTTKILRASDFDERGIAKVFFLQSASSTTSVCHRLAIYDGSTYIGTFDRQ